MSFTTEPLSAKMWPDLEAVSNARGCSVVRHCWCMYYRKSGRTMGSPGDPQKNRAALKSLASRGEQVGLIGYRYIVRLHLAR